MRKRAEQAGEPQVELPFEPMTSSHAGPRPEPPQRQSAPVHDSPAIPLEGGGSQRAVAPQKVGREPEAPLPRVPPEAEVLSVAHLDRLIKRLIEGATADVRVRGEVSGLRRAGSGHSYFSLKDEDEDALIDCVMYRSAPPRAHKLLREGERVVVGGRVTMYAPRGRLQFVAEDVLETGRGALLEALEKLKKKLAAEGLFDPARKKPLPSDPKTIAVLTSRDGAAIHDVCRVAFRRGRVRILLVATPVQGAGAPERIAHAIAFADRVAGLDAMIVTRGGGSAEDLMAYNDERVVRAIAAAKTPVVSAVGHEIDVTLADLAADRRAATPSQAAELLVADDGERRSVLAHLGQRLRRAAEHSLASARAKLGRLFARLGEPRRRLLEQSQRYDELEARLERAMRRRLARVRGHIERDLRRLESQHPRRVLAAARIALGPQLPALTHAFQARLALLARGVERHAARLDALSPLAVLSRGYAIATAVDGRVLNDARLVATGDRVLLRLHRGRLHTRVEKSARDEED